MWGVSGSASRSPDPRLVIRDLDAERGAEAAAVPTVLYSGDARGMGSADGVRGVASGSGGGGSASVGGGGASWFVGDDAGGGGSSRRETKDGAANAVSSSAAARAGRPAVPVLSRERSRSTQSLDRIAGGGGGGGASSGGGGSSGEGGGGSGGVVGVNSLTRRGGGSLGPGTGGSSGGGGSAAPSLSMGWLLRLFRSEFFDAWMAVTYLYRYRHSRGVHDYLCNELYHLSDADLEAFLPQLCNLLVYHARDSPALERFVMDKCADSMHFALQVYWFLHAAVDDAVRELNRDAEARARLLRTRCETAAVNGSPHIGFLAAAARDGATVAASVVGGPTSPIGVAASAATASGSAGDHPPISATLLTAGSPLTSRDAAASPPLSPRRGGGSHTRSSSEPRAGWAAVARALPGDDDGAAASDGQGAGDADRERSRRGSSSSGGGSRRRAAEADAAAAASATDAASAAADGGGDGSGTPASARRPPAPARRRVVRPDKREAYLHRMALERDAAADGGGVGGGGGVAASASEALSPPGGPVVPADKDVHGEPAAREARVAEVLADAERADRALEPTPAVATPRDGRPPPLAADACAASDVTAGGRTPSEGSAAAAAAAAAAPASEATSSADALALLTMKQERFDYFNDTLTIVKAFVKLSLTLRELPVEVRAVQLRRGLLRINDLLLARMAGSSSSVASPFGNATVPTSGEVARMGEVAALRSVHLPLARASEAALRILRVSPDEVTILNSRTRAPYMICIEVLETPALCADPFLFCHHVIAETHMAGGGGVGGDGASGKAAVPPSATPGNLVAVVAQQAAAMGVTVAALSRRPSAAVAPPPSGAGTPTRKAPAAEPSPSSSTTSIHRSSSSGSGADLTPAERLKFNVRKQVYGASARSVQPFDDNGGGGLRATDAGLSAEDAENAAKSRQAALLAVYGELWAWKEERVLRASPFGKMHGAKLVPFIVKAGDDLRQEQLAIQLIAQFDAIFKEESLDLYLRPFTVMCVSADSGLIETIADAVSLHVLKKRTPNFSSLLDYFERAYGKVGTQGFHQAQRRFIQSMAAYSVVTYLLQIKDRHNGNIMLDANGRIVHIDFGYILSNSPGAIKFESAPFKLTDEFIDVLAGRPGAADSAGFADTPGCRYFRELCVLGFLAARKHSDRLTTLVEIMLEGTSMPCMTGGLAVVEGLRRRFFLGVPESQCVSNVLGLIAESTSNSRSKLYDSFQYLTNGIM